jgi:hypothetical protein
MSQRTRLVPLFVVLSITAFLGSNGGCGGDDTSGGGTGATGSGAGASTNASTGAGGAPACDMSMVDPNDQCEVCSAMKCKAEATACCEKPHCLELIDCVRKTGCDTVDATGPMGCAQQDDMGGCFDEIMAATLDVANGEARALGNCAQMNCAMECGLMGAGGAGTGGGGGAGGG